MSISAQPPDENELKRLLQASRRREFFTHPIKAGWVTLYETWRNETEHGAIYCALVPVTSIAESLDDVSWDLSIGEAGPGCSVSYGPEHEEIIKYSRLGDHRGTEPLVLIREFHGIRTNYIELLEEFRLFHNLYHDRRANRFLKFDSAGNDNEIVRIEERRVLARARELRQFLAIKDMSLVLQIDSVSYSSLRLAEVSQDLREELFRDGEQCWRFGVYDDGMRGDQHNSFSRLLGKRVISGVDKRESGYWPYNDDTADVYPEFIIGADDNGDPSRFTCDPNKLSNYFGANPGSPHYLTPVYFRREVLQRYYSNASLYRVEDGAIRCASLWLLRIDNHLTDLVSVYLGDLGRDLPKSERDYWIPFNIQADAGISTPKLRRDFYAEFADPERADLLFKYRFEQFQQAWSTRFGWMFFQPLDVGDEHLFDTLREPLTDDQGEFDSQVLALTKLLIDSLNEKQISIGLTSLPKDARGLAKLDLFLSNSGVPNAAGPIEFLRSLQSLRSTGVGHRKGSKFEKAANAVQLRELGGRAAFRELIRRAREEVLETIGDHFLEAGWR